MSVRIHVVGAFNTSETKFRAALDLIGDGGHGSRRFRIGSSGRWQWANASVWQVNGSEIDDAIFTLPVPALRVTSSDGVLWVLTLTGPGNDTFRGVHHFTQVGSEPEDPAGYDRKHDPDFPEDEIEEVAGINRFIPELQFLWDAEEEDRLKKQYAEEVAATVEGLDDYADYGVTPTEAVIEEMKRHPHKAYHTAFIAHGTQIVDALEKFGFEFDRDLMLKLLTVGPLTDLEQDSDIGNMPRFLRALGFDGVFGDDSESDEGLTDEGCQEKDDKDETVDWSAYPPGELFERVEPLLAGCPVADIDGGPVQLTHGALLHILAHLCAEHPATSVLIELPNEATEPKVCWSDFDRLEVRRIGTKWHFCFWTPHWWYRVAEREELESNGLAASLGTLPDATRIEITFVVEGLAEKCHRYAGVYSDQCLEIDKAYPPVSANILNDALGLVIQIFDSQSIAFTPEEENAVRRNYHRSQGEVPKIRNRKIMPGYGSRDGVVQTLLFERFEESGPWDIAGARKLLENSWEEFENIVDPDEEGPIEPDESSEDDTQMTNMLQRMSEAIEKFSQAKIVPHGDEVVYEGNTGKFLRASMNDLKHIPAGDLKKSGDTMRSLGFRCIGDVVGDADQRQEITRCYAGHPQAIALYSHRNENNQFDWVEVSDGMVSVDFSQGTIEFHTHFADGSSLATTSIEAATSKPDVGIYVRCYEDISIVKLWEKHLDGIRRFKKHCDTVPVDHLGFDEPVKFLAQTDSFLYRFMGAHR